MIWTLRARAPPAQSWLLGGGRKERAARRATTAGRGAKPPSGSRTKVRFDHALIRLDHAGWAFRDLLAVIEDEHGLAQPHHDLHVVLDEQDRLARVAKATHGIEELVQQRAVHAGGGLVEQHERRVAHQHTHALDELLLPEGEIAGVFVGERRELDEVEELAGARLRRLARSRRDDEQV